MKILAVVLFLWGHFCFGDWHSWDEEPEEGSLYMWVEINPCEEISQRQILHISHYHPSNTDVQWLYNGWWDVSQESVWKWLHEGSKVIYTP